jgi:predicted nucleic acid-binding protein
MRVVDTSVWVEWLIGSALGKRLAGEFPVREAWVVPTIVQLELSKWLLREADEERADSVIALTQKCVVVALDTHTALLAAELHQRHKLATADAIVYATAKSQGADLLTCDAHFEGLPDIAYFRKRV